jgi:hypothetical protein
LGGVIVSVFALVGDLFSPKSFAGLFAAAPSVSLATLILVAATNGSSYAAKETRSMIVGGVAFLVYASVVSWFLHVRGGRPRWVATGGLLIWLAVAAGGWAVWLRAT